MINGITTINHGVRAQLNLSLQEYVVMDFFQQCMEKGISPELNSVIMIAADFTMVKEYAKELEAKAFLVGYVPTKKWTSAVKKKEKKQKAKKEFTPPTLEEIVEFFKSEGYNKEMAEKAHKYYSLGEWKDKNGKQITFWKRVMISWFREEHKLKPSGTGILIEAKTYNR